MIDYKTISNGLLEARMLVPYLEAAEVFGVVKGGSRQNFILESRDVSHIYGRMSLIGVDPALRVSGKDEEFELEVLNERGRGFLEKVSGGLEEFCDEVEALEEGGIMKLKGKVAKGLGVLEESGRSKKKNIAQVVRAVLESCGVEGKVLLGLYGGFSYDFIRLFEDIPDLLPENDVRDFDLCVYDSFIRFDLLRGETEVVVYRGSTQEADEAIHGLISEIERGSAEGREFEFSIEGAEFQFSQREYEKLVEDAKQLAKEGELFEVVFANSLKAKFSGDPYGVYLKYREINPSPYLFYFNFGEDQLVGASPEMMVRVEDGLAHLRPISGTAKRGDDPIEDHDNMLALLADNKERAELDMLIDLGRNDLSRICEPRIEIKDYRFVEKYSRVMHTIAHLTGKLRKGYSALDALIACMNAGTLTGAPKVAAMVEIEKHEKERRGYYGGTIGYLTFSGEMDTGIIIRTAYVRGDELDLKAGATLLYDSVPEKEYFETVNKAQAFLDVIDQGSVGGPEEKIFLLRSP